MTMTADQIAGVMADHLEEAADTLVDQWIDWLQQRFRTRAVRALPRDAIRNHIPPVLRGIAAYLRSPLAAARAEMLGHLRLHAVLRRDQGYDLGELLAEFDGLAHLVGGDMRRFLDGMGELVSPSEAVDAYQRLSTGLRAVGFVTVDVFRDAELDHHVRMSKRMEEFSRTIAHEIRNPLHTLALGLSMLRKEQTVTDKAKRDRYIDMMEQALRRAADLLDNIRQLALVESGRSRTDQLQRLRTLHQEMFEELGPLSSRGRVGVHHEDEVPDVSVDVLAFQLAVVNVVGNGIKYADHDKGEPWVRVTYEVVANDEDCDDLVVRVQDNGLGIGGSYLNRVFQRHVRAHPEVADGTGLGLAITRQVLLERGGEISLTSEEGEGTTVTFRLPCYPGDVTLRSTMSQPRSIVGMAVRRQLQHHPDDFQTGATGEAPRSADELEAIEEAVEE